MQIRFVKNVQFTKVLKAEGRMREFNFRKINNADTELFTVNVCDDRGERILFHMQKDQNDWRLGSESLPAWIGQQENQLNLAIADELKSDQWN